MAIGIHVVVPDAHLRSLERETETPRQGRKLLLAFGQGADVTGTLFDQVAGDEHGNEDERRRKTQ